MILKFKFINQTFVINKIFIYIWNYEFEFWLKNNFNLIILIYKIKTLRSILRQLYILYNMLIIIILNLIYEFMIKSDQKSWNLVNLGVLRKSPK